MALHRTKLLQGVFMHRTVLLGAGAARGRRDDGGSPRRRGGQ